ncbi:BioY family protein [uncultured Pleomorphomonas sp.]|uniref:Biotin transporter n=1 Tax=uncultured Pleomorphomonas sp. TaxID=442121 RepID=A0A212LGF5_9HYPH|nr:biotin transporter BioY [uncultured Pleomorphomonas sp.]SCM76469.1 BioY family protein [uncultured Pleomorphomonas sp.]
MTSAASPTLLESLPFGSSATRNVVFAIAGSLALWASAKFSIPFYPVPFTMQTFVVLALGMVAGWRLATATFALYLLEGLAGLPVFAGTPERGIGLTYMMGPTGGYLIGMLAATSVVGCLAERGWGRSPLPTGVAMLIGNLVLYVPGVLWLGTSIGWDKPVLSIGFTSFVASDIVKVALAMAVMPALWKLAKKAGA